MKVVDTVVADGIVVADSVDVAVADDKGSSDEVVETSFRDYGKLGSLKINKGCN